MKTNEAFSCLQMKTLAVEAGHALQPAVGAVNSALSTLGEFMRSAVRRPPSVMEMAARDLAYTLARVYMGKGSQLNETTKLFIE